jgi:hypothetical protein
LPLVERQNDPTMPTDGVGKCGIALRVSLVRFGEQNVNADDFRLPKALQQFSVTPPRPIAQSPELLQGLVINGDDEDVLRERHWADGGLPAPVGIRQPTREAFGDAQLAKNH